MSNRENSIYRLWKRLQRWPLGHRVFSFVINRYVPYTGSMGATVIRLEPGFARIRLRERRKVRNHLHSIHAIALANLAELTANLALMAGLPEDARFIPEGISVDYLKKARGIVVGEARTEVLSSNEKRRVEIHVQITDAQGDVVVRSVIRSLVGPKKSPP